MSISQDTYNRLLATNCQKQNHWMAPYTKGIDQCGGYFIFAIPTSSRYLKNSETKNCQFWVFKSFQNQRIAGFGYLKKKNQI